MCNQYVLYRKMKLSVKGYDNYNFFAPVGGEF